MSRQISKSKERRFKKTLQFINKSQFNFTRVLDIGTPNPLSKKIQESGYEVFNTQGEDLDLFPEIVASQNAEAATAFEILEHLVNPMGVLKLLKTEILFASIPLSLWFAKAYRNKNDPWDQHFHEFEDWQFDWLLDKAGWQIIRSEKWTSPIQKVGFRPILRLFTPRYYIVEAIRKK